MVSNASSRALRAVLAFMVAASFLTISSCGSTRISRSEEIRLGQRAAAEIERQHRTWEDPTVSRIGQSVAAASEVPDLPYRFRVIDQNEANAFALPGGPVYVTDELLQLIGGDRDQLAGVLAHEVAHITRRHAARQMERQGWLGLGIEVLTEGTVQDIATIAANIQLLSYSREQEYEADSRGVQYMQRAGYNPMGLVRFLERLSSMEKGGSTISWLRTHPGSQARADRLRKMIRS